MEPWGPLIIRCRSCAPLHLPFPAGQRHHLGWVRLRRERFAEQEMSRPSDRFLFGAETRMDGRAHVDSWRRIARRKKTLRGGSVSKRVRQNKFRHAHSAET